MESKSTGRLAAVALCATISISVGPLALGEDAEGLRADQRIELLRKALSASGAEVATPGKLPEVIAQFNDSFSNTFRNGNSCAPRTC